MTARGDNPRLHRIEVERDEHGDVESVRFVCDGDKTSPCHQWPDCGCEQWDPNLHGWRAGQVVSSLRGPEPEGKAPEPGHEDVPQEHCWIDPWLNDALTAPVDWLDVWDGSGEPPTWETVRSGPISVTFEGDYMTWEYAEVGA